MTDRIPGSREEAAVVIMNMGEHIIDTALREHLDRHEGLSLKDCPERSCRMAILERNRGRDWLVAACGTNFLIDFLHGRLSFILTEEDLAGTLVVGGQLDARRQEATDLLD